MTDPLTPNFTSGAGRLAVDRFDFQNHVDGYNFKHNATGINVYPTIDINGNTITNLQDFAEAIADGYFTPPTNPDASSSVKGILELSGDLGGTATTPTVVGLRGYPISITPPSTDDILTWSGTSWTPQSNPFEFTAAGDLGGTSTLQQVLGITGTSGIISVNGDIINFILGTTPLITQSNNNTTDATDLTIRAQSATVINKNGGNVIIAGGKNGNGGLKGGVILQLTSSVAGSYPNSLAGITATNILEVTEVATNRRVISLCNANDITATDVPTGDMLIYIRNVSTAPTSAPVSGFEIYSKNGNPYFYTSGGTKLGITGTSAGASFSSPADGFLTIDIGGVSYKIPYFTA